MESRRPRIVILGGGFAGAYCARELEGLLGPDEAEVVLLDRNNYFVFYPLLVEAGTGSLEPRHAVVSLRSFVTSTRFLRAEIVAVDTRAREVTYRLANDGQPQQLTCDHLVLALGSVTNLPPIPGLAEHGFEIKSMADAVALRDRAINQLELADAETNGEDRRSSLVHFVVVGGSFTGVEVAGELEVFLRRAAKQFPSLVPSDCRVTLLEREQRILPALGESLSAFAMHKLRQRGIAIRLGEMVERVERDRVVLHGGGELDASTVIWCAGVAPNPLVRDLDAPTDERGYIVCEADMSVQDLDQVWAIGDSAVNRGPDGRAYPATAQHALQQGRQLARNIVRRLHNEPTRGCVIRDKGAIVALGCRTGVAEVFGIRISGFMAWFLFRTVYLLKMPGVGRRLRVALEWTIDLVFPKDPVQLGLTRREVHDKQQRGPTSGWAE